MHDSHSFQFNSIPIQAFDLLYNKLTHVCKHNPEKSFFFRCVPLSEIIIKELALTLVLSNIIISPKLLLNKHLSHDMCKYVCIYTLHKYTIFLFSHIYIALVSYF